jgi:hypothetical protein
MGRRAKVRSPGIPRNAQCIKTIDQLGNLMQAFANGSIPLLVVLGKPGLSKTQTIKKALVGKSNLYIKGRRTPITFYCDAFTYQDKPICLDDANNFIEDKLNREMLRALTETDAIRRMEWSSKTRILEEAGVPADYWTKSPVAIITNFWNGKDPIFQALESRAEFCYFAPSWDEVYRNMGTWFWDQEIYDYIYDRLDVLREPDVRIAVKAYNRKVQNLPFLPWRDVIDNYVDDACGLAVRKVMKDAKLKTPQQKVVAFQSLTGMDRATFYRRRRDIEEYMPSCKPPRILITRTAPPEEKRPAAGAFPGLEDAF